MKKLLVLSLILSFVAFGFTSCSKYEDGPALSLRTKTARLTGVWNITKAYQNGVEVNPPVQEKLMFEFKKDNTCTYGRNGVTLEGDWDFNDDKTELEILIDGDSQATSFVILKLKNKELILEQTVSNPEEYHFEKDK